MVPFGFRKADTSCYAVTIGIESKDFQVNYWVTCQLLVDEIQFGFGALLHVSCISLPVLKIQFDKLFVTVFAL